MDSFGWVQCGKVGVEWPDNVGPGRGEGLLGDVWKAGWAKLGGWPWVNKVGVVSGGFLNDCRCDLRVFGS